MPARRWRKLAILHKIEATEGVDAAPAAADAIVATNVSFSPIEAEEVRRDLILPYLGNQGMLLAAEYGRMEFDVEIAGAGAAGDVPKYGSLLRVCGLAETVSAGVSVTYSIVEDGVESGSIHFNSDGVRHVFLGARANVAMSFAPSRIPHFRFTMMGVKGTVADVALPTVSQAGWTTPVIASSVNTAMTLHGSSAVTESLEIDLGNTVTPRFLIGAEHMQIADRQSTGTAVIEGRHVADFDLFGKIAARDRGALSLVHGTAAGNIVEIDAPAVEFGRPSQGESDGFVTYSVPLALCPVAGLDELTITVR
ncbi:hypothetical protein RGUI_2771 [Rhodovulum sp. P5]|uniref:phage tail tube protein n=1 Tax=Rhodovulum sp. P5 TaxID=1564506 RepID=UPI0009C32632|nr:phage tail tube protein [Rhodovulum sp. P5]ARE40912.1 hypothetical protein RGUI_2771 [Rhodovulum sp. P5]